MLTTYHRIAVRLSKLSGLIWGCLLITTLMCGYVIFAAPHSYSSDQELAFFVLPVWFLSMIVLVNLFIEPVDVYTADDGLYKRVKSKMTRAVRWIIALVFSVVTLFMFYLSLKAIMFYL